MEDAFVSVPLTNDIMTGVRSDGGPCPDGDKITAAALTIGSSDGVDWQVESTGIDVHPVQCPLPEGREVYVPEGDIDWWEGSIG